MPSLTTRFLAFLAGLALAVLAVGPAQASPLPRTVEKELQAVVQAQLDAFAQDDAKRAFSYASPDIRRAFGTPERFMAMVRVGYPVVHRPRSVVFLKPERVRGEIILPVQMTDEQGQAWLASYVMKQQKNKSWRIGGCSVVEDDRLST